MLPHNDSDTGVLDTLMYEHFNNVPRTEVSDYLYELEAYGLIEISPKASGEDYGLVNITRQEKDCSCSRSVSQIGYE